MSRSILPCVLAVSSVVALFGSASPAWGQKRPTGYKYSLTDLMGFNDHGYQSQGQFLTNRAADGTVMILGNSRRYPDPSGPAVFHPALWNINANGTFSATGPVDLELPDWSAEVMPTGFNRWGMSVGKTTIANTRDANGNWIVPAYVDVPGLPYQKLPGVYGDSAKANAINDDGIIVGSAAFDDPNSPTGTVEGGALWSLNADGTVGQPIFLGSFVPSDINNSAVMAGMIDNYPALGYWSEGALVIRRMPAAPRYLEARVAALNDYPFGDPRLAVVGTSARNDRGVAGASDSERGFVWRPFNSAAPTVVLGTLGGMSSQALDVNRAEQVAGWATDKRGNSQAVVYANGTPTNLNTAADVGDRVLQQALGINEAGDIVGFMHVPRPASEQHGFLLRFAR